MQIENQNQIAQITQPLQNMQAIVTLFLRPATENVQSQLLPIPATLQIGGNQTVSAGLTGSVERGYAIDTSGNIGRYVTFSKGLTSGEGISGSLVITSRGKKKGTGDDFLSTMVYMVDKQNKDTLFYRLESSVIQCI